MLHTYKLCLLIIAGYMYIVMTDNLLPLDSLLVKFLLSELCSTTCNNIFK